MVVVYSAIGLISALLMPEVRDRDLSILEDAAEDKSAALGVNNKHRVIS